MVELNKSSIKMKIRYICTIITNWKVQMQFTQLLSKSLKNIEKLFITMKT